MSSVSTTSSRRVRAHGTDRRHRSSAGKKSSSPQEDISLRKSFADSMLFDNEDLDTLEDLKNVRAPSSLETAMMSSVSTLPSSGAGDVGDDPAMSQRRLSSSVSTRRFNEWDSTLSNRNFEDLSALDRANREVAGRTLASFTVTDPRYQRSEEYFPDKINDWVEVSAKNICCSWQIVCSHVICIICIISHASTINDILSANRAFPTTMCTVKWRYYVTPTSRKFAI